MDLTGVDDQDVDAILQALSENARELSTADPDAQEALRVYNEEIETERLIRRLTAPNERSAIDYEATPGEGFGQARPGSLDLSNEGPDAAKPQPGLEGSNECVICEESTQESAPYNAPCGHQMCQDCLESCVQSSMTIDGAFPPRCCDPLPFDSFRDRVTQETMAKLEEMQRKTDDKDWVYCHKAECGTYIPPGARNEDNATCPACEAKTCTFCRGEDHIAECPHDEQTALGIQQARDLGMMRCERCKHFVELDFGCYHMRCRCQHQFCYLCGLEWKSCQCPRWSEARLITREEQDRQEERARVQEVPYDRGVEIARITQGLQRRQDCTHTEFRRIEGGSRCERCHDLLDIYIMRCTHCSMEYCLDCQLKHHRMPGQPESFLRRGAKRMRRY